MKKIDLARQYCLSGTPSNALHKLNRYIRDVKGLKEALIRHGYHSKGNPKILLLERIGGNKWYIRAFRLSYLCYRNKNINLVSYALL